MASTQSELDQAPDNINKEPISYKTIQHPRERSVPLVPTPFEFDNHWPIGYLYNATADKKVYRFLPNLKNDEYEASLSELERLALRDRANKLSRKASSNHEESSSEFWTEVLAWSYVFQQFYEDSRFRMDKRSYDFLHVDIFSKAKTVKQRIPDATIGLRSFSDEEISHKQNGCRRRRCQICHEQLDHVDQRLSKSKLAQMLNEPECALIVNGVWGEKHLLFPFAVYEAKKSYDRFQEAYTQVSHACATYLAMLDDLARNPDNVGQYQTADSATYQMFAFISCGSRWEVYIASAEHATCSVKTIWRGNISDRAEAYELLCLVNQVYHFAVHHHTPFVTSYLQRWLDHLEVLNDPLVQREEGPIGLHLAKINPGIDQYFKSFPEEDRPHLYKIPTQVRIANGAMDQYRRIREDFRQAKGWSALKANSRGLKRNKGKAVQPPMASRQTQEPPTRVEPATVSSAMSKFKLRRFHWPRKQSLLEEFTREAERFRILGRLGGKRPSEVQNDTRSLDETRQTGQATGETSSQCGNHPHDKQDVFMIDVE